MRGATARTTCRGTVERLTGQPSANVNKRKSHKTHVNLNSLLDLFISLVVLIMTPPPRCCNPFSKKRHNSVKNNLFLLSDKCNVRFRVFFGKYVCVSCKRRLYESDNSIIHAIKTECEKNNESSEVEDENSAEENEEEHAISKKDSDYISVSVDNERKKLKLVAELENVIMAPDKKKRV